MDSRTPNTHSTSSAAAELKAVLEELAVEADFASPSDEADLILPGQVFVQVKSAARPTLSQLRRWGLGQPGPRSAWPVVVVADWIDPALREDLRQASWGWLDRSGHLRLIAGGFHIDREIEPLLGPEVQRPSPLRRESGLAVAIELLARKAAVGRSGEWDATVREVAAAAHVSVGSAHKAITELADLSLLDKTGRPRSSLFWSTAREWRVRWFPLSQRPGPDVSEAVQSLLRFGLHDLDNVGWAEAGDGAAAAYGAPIVSEGPPRLLLPDQRALTWALRTFGEAHEERSASAFVGVAPAQAAVRRRQPGRLWPRVRPLIVALHLANSGPRGREALEQWPDRPVGMLDDE